MHFRNDIFGGKAPILTQIRRWLTKGIVRKTIVFGFLFIFLIGSLRFYVAIVRAMPDLSDISQ